jgi:SAM-dependent methyltransferase
MKVTSENFRPNRETLQYIRDIGTSMGPYISDNIWAQRYMSGHALRISFDYELVQRFLPATGTVVDVGASPPWLTTALSKKGHKVIGLDLDPDRFAAFNNEFELDIRKADVENEKLPFDDNSIDLIIFNEIFEHMRIDLIRVFNELHRVLKPGGQILMSTPNGLSMHALYQIMKKRQIGPSIHFEYEKLTRIGHMGHVREYAVNEVLEFLAAMNFEVPEIIYRGRYHNRFPDLILRTFNRLRPFVSFVIRKPML